jgi:hypothetical protein
VGDLAPGDMAVIVASPDIPMDARHAVGRTVVLIETCRHKHAADLMPFWRCSGVPQNWCVSHKVLRKIPPAPLEREIPDVLEIVG